LGDKLQRAGRVDYGCKVSNERTCCKHEVLWGVQLRMSWENRGSDLKMATSNFFPPRYGGTMGQFFEKTHLYKHLNNRWFLRKWTN
jgi:hypothetical protein